MSDNKVKAEKLKSKRNTKFNILKKALLIISVICAFYSSITKAQTSQGKVLVGVSTSLNLTGTGADLMSIGYTSSRDKSDSPGSQNDPDEMFSVNILPKVGFFVIDNLALGFDANLAIANIKSSSGAKQNTTLVGIGPFFRYYVPTSVVYPFFEMGGSLGIMNRKFSSNGSDDDFKASIIVFNTGLGFAFPLGDKVTFDIMAGYNRIRIKPMEDNDNNYRTINGTIGLKLGFVVLLSSN